MHRIVNLTLCFTIACCFQAAAQQDAPNAAHSHAGHDHAGHDHAAHAEIGVLEFPKRPTGPPSELRKDYEAKTKLWIKACQDFWGVYNEFHVAKGDVSFEEQLRYGKAEAAMRDAMDVCFRSACALIDKEPGYNDAGGLVVEGVKYRLGFDWYEGLVPAGKALIKAGGGNNPVLFSTVGASAFTMNDYDTAEEYLKLAQEKDALTDITRGMLYKIDNFRQRWKKESALREAEAKADDLPRVRFNTTRGPIVIELFENEAPNTVANFISLVESKQYDNMPFYNVLENEYAMTGDRNGDGSGNAGYRIKDEANHPNARMILRGSLLMAKLANPLAEMNPSMPKMAPNTASNQFMIRFLPMPPENTEMTCFGRVIEGMPAVITFNRVKPEKKKNVRQIPPDILISCEVIRKRDHKYEPEKLPFGP